MSFATEQEKIRLSDLHLYYNWEAEFRAAEGSVCNPICRLPGWFDEKFPDLILSIKT